METQAAIREDAAPRRLSLMRELVDCLGRERERLVKADVKGLWEALEEKRAILAAMKELPAPPPSSPPELKAEMSLLKEEIRARTRENVEFTRSSLELLDELISLITGAGKEDQGYTHPGARSRRQRPPVYRRKV
jgi:hypothetical protein